MELQQMKLRIMDHWYI